MCSKCGAADLSFSLTDMACRALRCRDVPTSRKGEKARALLKAVGVPVQVARGLLLGDIADPQRYRDSAIFPLAANKLLRVRGSGAFHVARALVARPLSG